MASCSNFSALILSLFNPAFEIKSIKMIPPAKPAKTDKRTGNKISIFLPPIKLFMKVFTFLYILHKISQINKDISYNLTFWETNRTIYSIFIKTIPDLGLLFVLI